MMTTMNTGAASLSDEQIEALKAAALAATPQNFDSAEIKRDGGACECPTCGGEGYVEIERDYCNYDDHALGVQFYGIGKEFGAAEAYFRAVKPATILALIDRLERAEATPTPQADAAPIINGHAINDLFLKWSEWTTELGEAISRKNIDGFVSELRAAIAAGGAQEVAQSWIDGVAAELWAISDVSGFDDFKLAVGGFLIATALPRVAATVALTDKQREAIEWAAGRAHVEALGKPIDGAEGKRWRLLSDMFRAAASNGEQA